MVGHVGELDVGNLETAHQDLAALAEHTGDHERRGENHAALGAQARHEQDDAGQHHAGDLRPEERRQGAGDQHRHHIGALAAETARQQIAGEEVQIDAGEHREHLRQVHHGGAFDGKTPGLLQGDDHDEHERRAAIQR